MSAAMQGHLAMVRLLLKHNASVDLQSDVGHTALKAAKVFGHTDGEGAAIRGR
jgi:ankyrin repeat protein